MIFGFPKTFLKLSISNKLIAKYSLDYQWCHEHSRTECHNTMVCDATHGYRRDDSLERVSCLYFFPPPQNWPYVVETSVFILIGIIHYILIQAGLTILYKGPKITKVKNVFVEDPPTIFIFKFFPFP